MRCGSFGMGIAYAVASFTQGVATFVLPATGHRIGLAHSMELFVIAASILIAAVIIREPRKLPGRDAAAIV